MKPDAMSGAQPAAPARRPSKLAVDAEGVIDVPAFKLPLSAALSPEARQAQIRSMRSELQLPSFEDVVTEAEFIARAEESRRMFDEMFLIPLSQALLSAYPVEITPGSLGGVPVETFTPPRQKAPGRVLINLHGGGFFTGAIHGGRAESIPVAALGEVKVVSVDYRQGYEHRYPAATEDVFAVYKALLADHAPEEIGMFGGSAGGRLTAQAVAWILKEGLPPPAAAGVFGSGAGGDGDAAYFGKIGVAEPPPPPALTPEILPAQFRSREFGYFAGVPVDDPMATPINAPKELLARFPPTLFITATRAFDLSPAILFHRALTRAGAEASLHVFDGFGHCFYYNAFLPEAQDAYTTIVSFFDRHLAG
jgi:acetyl esterase/lipase